MRQHTCRCKQITHTNLQVCWDPARSARAKLLHAEVRRQNTLRHGFLRQPEKNCTLRFVGKIPCVTDCSASRKKTAP